MTTAASIPGRLALFLLLTFTSSCARSDPPISIDDPRSPLRIVRTIPLPDVRGRIDHLSFDEARNHLFVAEYGNGSVDDIDLRSGAVRRITGLREPQGVIWLAKQQEIAVATGDGLLRFYRGSDHAKVARINLGDDADNVRLDTRNSNLVVGYGSGGIAVVDPGMHRVVRELKLGAHPEAFALVGSQVFVNLPDAHKIAVADLDKAQVITKVDTGRLSQNYPMTVDAGGSRIAVAYRSPSTLSVIQTSSGATISSVPICGDADDLYFRAGQIVVVCGEGAIDVIDDGGEHRNVRVATRRGARTGLLVLRGSSLFVAVPAQGNGAAIWQLAFR